MITTKHLHKLSNSDMTNRSLILFLSWTHVKYRIFLTRVALEIILYGKKMNGPITYNKEKSLG